MGRKGQVPWNKDKTGVYSNETRQSMGAKNIGRKKTEEEIEKIRIANTGRKKTEEEIENIRKSVNEGFENGREVWNKDKTGVYSEETLRKMSEGKKGQIAPNKGIPMSKEQRKKMEPVWEENRNYKHTDEAIEKIRIARLHQVFPQKNSIPETILHEELEKRKIPFKTHVSLNGQPDIFIEPNICVFADSDWFHGYKYMNGHDCTKYKIMNNEHFDKVIQYDKKITQLLIENGYSVLRFWEHEIKKDLEKCIQKIIKAIK